MADSKSIKFPVFLVHSQWSLADIDEFIRKFGDENHRFGPIRIQRINGKETSRTICLFDHDVYNKMARPGYNERQQNGIDFCVVPFGLRPYNFPGDAIRNLFIPLPSKLSTRGCQAQLGEKLNSLVIFRVVRKDDFWLKIPLKSRETGEHKNFAIVNFKEDVDIQRIAMCRVIIDESHWNIDETSRELAHCYWMKPQRKKIQPNGILIPKSVNSNPPAPVISHSPIPDTTSPVFQADK